MIAVVVYAIANKAHDRNDHSDGNGDASSTNGLLSVDYKHNMQFIQNFMGEYCEAYDSVSMWLREFQATHDAHSLTRLLLYLLGSVPLSWLASFVIPWRWACMVGGVTVLVANTALFQASYAVVAPILLSRLQDHVPNLIVLSPAKALDAFAKDSEENPQPLAKTAGLYENQRWWVGLGWSNILFHTDPPAWTDENGQRASPKDSFEAPEGLPWINEWQFDRDWSVVGVDTEGWVYTDNAWKNPRPKGNLISMTRRRMWTRQYLPQSNDKASDDV